MRVRVEFVDGALSLPAGSRATGGSPGAILMFEGIVRGTEDGRAIDGLFYEVYEPMAARETDRLAREVGGKHGLLSVDVTHSRGMVPVGEVSFRVVIESTHRAEALAAMGEFIDRFKRDVPVWKSERRKTGS